MVNSRYKHIFTDEPKKKNTYTDMPASGSKNGVSNLICASAKYFFYPKSGANQGVIMQLGHPDRVAREDQRKVSPGHKGDITEAAFCPHDDGMLATGGLDGKVCILKFSDDDFTEKGLLKEDKTDCWQQCEAGQKDIISMAWNPAVAGLLAVGSKNKHIYFIDATSGEECFDCVGPFDGTPLSMCWSFDGKWLCFTISDSKNHKLYVWDPRTGQAVSEIGTACKTTSQVFWCGKQNLVGVVGNRADTNKRICKIYNPETGKKVGTSQDLPSGSSVMKPYYDSSRDMLWVYGKGNSSVNFQTVAKNEDGSATLKSLGIGRIADVVKGGCFINMRACKVMECEAQRFMAILQTGGTIAPYKFEIPRKNQSVFHADVFPDVPHKLPSLSLSQYTALAPDADMPARKMYCLNPDAKQNDDGEFVFEKKASYFELEKNYNALLEIVKANQEKLAGVDLSQFLES